MDDTKETVNRRRRGPRGKPAGETIKAREGPGAFQKAFQYRRRLEASYGVILRNKERIRAVIRAVLLTSAAALIACVVAGSVLLESAETCRYPRYEYTETFTYKIDLKATQLSSIYSQGKRTTIIGMKIRHLFLSQEFGTYTIVADPDPSLTEVKFIVSNRARDQYFLPRITTLSAEVPIQDPEDENRKVDGKFLPFNELVADVYLFSNTSNMMYGDHSCKRADVTIVVPSACLLDESKLDVKVNKGHIRTMGDISQANFDTVSLVNEVGQIVAQNMQGFRIDVKTSTGSIEARNISAHFLLLSSKEDGGVIKANNVTLYSGDNKDSCQRRDYWKDGFPQLEKYRQEIVVCEKELGKLTVDSRGAENGGFPAIEIDRVSGGDIKQIMNLGHSTMKLKACYDFFGHFNISSINGAEIVTPIIKPLTQLEQLLEASDSTDEAFGTNTSTSATPPWLEILTRSAAWTYGKISCPMGAAGQAEMMLEIITNTTGDITLDIVEPRLDWNGPEEV